MSRFFHTLVVFGASLPACGGTTIDTLGTGDPDPGAGGDGGAGNSASGGRSTGGMQTTGTGGTRPTGTGGTRPTGTGGTQPAGAGGTQPAGAGGQRPQGSGGRLAASGGSPASGGATTDAGVPYPATAAQWSCETTTCGYLSGPGPLAPRLWLDGPCPVDTSRPRTRADCAPDQWFECVAATYLELGAAISVNCRCVTLGTDGRPPCDRCLDRHSTDNVVEVLSCEDHEKLCGCALTVILR